jgi:hypothetical protein
MLIPFHRFAVRQLGLAIAIALLPAAALAWGSQSGDNGRQPLGADNEGPRQAIPNAMSNDVPIDYQAGTAYYAATTAHQRALYYCDQKPVEFQQVCRDAADARYGYPVDGYVAMYPGYMTYYYPPTGTYYPQQYGVGTTYYWRYDTYAVSPEYYVVSPYPGDTSTMSMNSLNRCAPLYAAARAECLHGSTPGG